MFYSVMVAHQSISESLGSNPSKTTNLKLINMDLTNFNAEQARSLFQDKQRNELHSVLNAISVYAEYTNLLIWRDLYQSTIEELLNRGFEVRKNPYQPDKFGKPTYKIFW